MQIPKSNTKSGAGRSHITWAWGALAIFGAFAIATSLVACGLLAKSKRKQLKEAQVEQFSPPSIGFPAATLVENAELVFQGTVEKIEYKHSEKTEGQKPIVHTFVSYSVERLFKGKVDAGELFTLRFLGGPLGGQRVLLPSGFPAFDVGDSDILFVRGNGKSVCPLVFCDRGRLRLIGDDLLDEYGHALVKERSKDFVWGRRIDNEGTRTNRIGTVNLARRFSEIPTGEGSQNPTKDTRASVAYEELASLLQLHAQRSKKSAQQAQSMAPNQPFRVSLTKPRRPGNQAK